MTTLCSNFHTIAAVATCSTLDEAYAVIDTATAARPSAREYLKQQVQRAWSAQQQWGDAFKRDFPTTLTPQAAAAKRYNQQLVPSLNQTGAPA